MTVPKNISTNSTTFPVSELDLARELIERYSGSGPRYTSYPTAVEFTPSFGPSEWRTALREDQLSWGLDSAPTASLYFHLPYCRSLCYFCACNKVITRDAAVNGPYLKTVAKELALLKNALSGEMLPIEQIHWGGGSPNFLTPEEMGYLHGITLETFPELVADADVSIELDPRSTTIEQIKKLHEIGFNRISLGVQDFDPRVQTAINRIQSYEDTAALIECARNTGFQGVNVDLIYGLSFQTVASFSSTIERVLRLRPDRVALYGYAHVTWLQKVQRTLERDQLPTPEERVAIFLEAARLFTEAGYEYIGLDHFALPSDSLSRALGEGKLNRNFMGYTSHRGARIYAFGASAISSLPGAFSQNEKDVDQYRQRVEGGEFAAVKGLIRTTEDMIRGEVIEHLLCRGEVEYSAIESRFEIDFRGHFAGELEELEGMADDGLLVISQESLRLTPLGRLFARNAAMIFDAYLEHHRAQTKRVFSQSI